MKEYIFNVTKKLNKLVKIYADDKEKAKENLVNIVLKSNAIDFKNVDEIDTDYEAEFEGEYADFDENIESRGIQITDYIPLDEELENDGIIDDFPREFKEIVCDKCENCMRVDED